MSSAPLKLSQCIIVGRRFLRSVNLERDFSSDEQSGEYIVTPTGRELLHRLSEGLEANAACRALTITGPYGVGKSAFAVFASQLFCGRGPAQKRARELLSAVDPALVTEIDELPVSDQKLNGMLPVLVTARRAPAPVCLVEGLVSALNNCKNGKLRSLAKNLAATVGGTGVPDSRRVVEAFAAVATAARDAGYSGVFLIVDEMGKLFEYAARDTQKGDVYVLQELAEYAARSGEFPVLFLGLLHQTFEEYARHLDMLTRREWAKIHGRFEDKALIEPAEQVLRMMSKAIRWNAAVKCPPALGANLRKVARVATRSGGMPAGMREKEFEDAVHYCHPLHPLAAMALPYLFYRFAQNERSLFSFLSSMEPGGFQHFLKSTDLEPDEPKLIRLEHLFDYFTNNFGAGLFRHPHARRWMEAADALERRTDLEPAHRTLVKTIGILNALGEFCHLAARENVIACAVDDAATLRASTAKALKELGERSLLTYRKFNHTYRIWEGSDVDIEDRVAEGERKVRHGLSLAESVQRYVMPRPIVARRHSFETGAVRFFEVRYLDNPEDVGFRDTAQRGADGQILVCLSESSAVAEQFQRIAERTTDRGDILFAIPQQIGELRATAMELAALRWAWDNTPGLRDDRVARRELALRIAEAEQMMLRCLDGLLDPRPTPVGSGCLWFCKGRGRKAKTPADVSQILSTVCEELYPDTPKIRNELIARRVLSAAAASARRSLVEAMLLRGDKPLLGMDGYPPERSMYESVLLATGLHAETGDGSWGFRGPKKGDHNLGPCWTKLTERIFATDAEPVKLDLLFKELAGPGLGVVDGLHPVLLCAFMLAHSNETTLYREGTFIPEPVIADYEVLMRRPEFFAVAGCRVSGGRVAILERLAEKLNVKAATVPVVRALFRAVKGFPEYAWKTRRLTPKTIALREAFENAKSPEKFLFVGVPEALGLSGFAGGRVKQEDVEVFFNALNNSMQTWAACAGEMLDHARDTLLEACGYEPGDVGWEALRRDAVRIESGVTETQLLAFIRRVIQAGTGRDGVDSVVAFVANRPPMNWADTDVDRYPDTALVIGRAFRDAVANSGRSRLDVCRLEDLPPREKKMAEQIVSDVQEHLERNMRGKPSRAIAAAFAVLAQKYQTAKTLEQEETRRER